MLQTLYENSTNPLHFSLCGTETLRAVNAEYVFANIMKL